MFKLIVVLWQFPCCICQIIAKALEGLSLETDSDFQKVLRVTTYTSMDTAVKRLEEMVPLFQSRMGAMLFLISALLSRGLVWFSIERLILWCHLTCFLVWFSSPWLGSPLTLSDLKVMENVKYLKDHVVSVCDFVNLRI